MDNLDAFRTKMVTELQQAFNADIHKIDNIVIQNLCNDYYQKLEQKVISQQIAIDRMEHIKFSKMESNALST